MFYKAIHKLYLIVSLFLLMLVSGWSQTPAYQKKKAEKIAKGSVFTKIINRESPANIIYEDDDVIAFLPLRKQAPVHILIVPKKEIPTMNDITDADTLVLGKMFLVTKKLAKENGIAETGYRLTFNTNEDAGQSVFHIHLHLVGGEKLPPMLPKKGE